MSEETEKCPECGCQQVNKVWKREPFSLPNPASPMEPPDKLMVRYPISKCAACQNEYRTKETYAVVGRAISEHLEHKLDAMEVETANMKRLYRNNWMLQGMIVGSLFAHSLNLLMLRRWYGGGAMAVASVLMAIILFNSERVFALAARLKSKRVAKKQKDSLGPIPSGTVKVDDDLMEKLLGYRKEE